MKILIVAPEICSPWTEGRKRYVHDLIEILGKNHKVKLLTTVKQGQEAWLAGDIQSTEVNSGLGHLVSLAMNLAPMVKDFQPDLVCHFPYSTFYAYYGPANKAAIWAIDRISRRFGVLCLTIMYSICGTSMEGLKGWASNLVVNQFARQPLNKVRLGIKTAQLPIWKGLDRQGQGRRLLFMAGMWAKTEKNLNYICEVRGLDLLLRAGRVLAAQGLSLRIASPLLTDEFLAAKILADPCNTWPSGSLEIIGQVLMPDIFADVDLFVFPYNREETQFVPTSALEAMACGIPVVLPDLDFLKDLAADGRNTFVFHHGDPDSLAETVSAALTNKGKYADVRENGMAFVRNSMEIQGACSDLLSLYDDLAKP